MRYPGRLVILCLFMVLPVTQAAKVEFGDRIQYAVVVFKQATQGKSDAVPKALALFKEIEKTHPNHPLLRSYIGSLTTMQARDAWMPWNKIRFAEKGLDMIDRVLDSLSPEHDLETNKSVPVSLEVKFIAASTFTSMPKFFNRRPQGRQLLKTITSSKTFTKTPPGFQATVWLTRARAVSMGDSKKNIRPWLKRVTKLDPTGRNGKIAAAMLAK